MGSIYRKQASVIITPREGNHSTLSINRVNMPSGNKSKLQTDDNNIQVTMVTVLLLNRKVPVNAKDVSDPVCHTEIINMLSK